MRFFTKCRFICGWFAFENVCVNERFSFPLVLCPVWSARPSMSARLYLNKSPWSESNASISIWASPSLGVVGTATSQSSGRRLMAVFLRQDRGFDPSGSRQLPIKESDRDQCSVSLRQMASYFSFNTQTADRKSCNFIGWFVTREK